MTSVGSHFGLVVIGFGLVLDIVAHGVGDLASAHIGHVVVILGMVLTLIGVVRDGVRRSRLPADGPE